jgi:signal peptidase II
LPVIENIFHITLTYNKGIAFGWFSEYSYLPSFLALSSALLYLLIFVFNKNIIRKRWRYISLGFIIGGAAGNLIDRIRLGKVIDFIDFRIWPIFNLADSFICIGMAIAFFYMLKEHRNNKSVIGS